MAMGPGKYDHEAEMLAQTLEADGLLLVVFAGVRGYGVSGKTVEKFVPQMPRLLRRIADEMERDFRPLMR